MNSSFIQEPQTQKLSLNSSIKDKPFSSSRSNCSGFSRDISCNKDSYVYCSCQKVKNHTQSIKHPHQETYKKSLMILQPVGCENLCPNNQMGEYYYFHNNQAYNYFIVDRNHWYVDELIKPKTNQKRLPEDDKDQLVNLRENNCYEKDSLQENNHCNISPNSSFMNVVSMDEKLMGTQRTKFPFHVASIPKPQDEYNIVVNNVNQPFEHVWLQRSKDGSRYVHPLEKFTFYDFVDKDVSKFEPVIPPPTDGTPLNFVQEVQELKELVHKLRNATEFAVDLEHNQYRSFQGLTCLMQISTRTEDFIVDTFKLRVHIGPYLREVFKDPTKKKVMHGADKDIVWLQRDFGIYVCNMFDTGQASRVLKMEKNSLEYLLLYFCGVPLNKEYQKADWRLRPLTNEMLRYARDDTHYLLYLHDLMKKRLLSLSTDPNFPELPIMEVYRRSYDICIQLYQKELLTEYSYLNIYGLHEADLNGRQLSIVAALCEWRDIVARAADESTGYVLSNKNVIEIAKQMPTTTGDLCRLLKFRNLHIQQNLCSILSIIQNSEQNAAAFDEIAKKLKHERIEIEASRTANKRSEEAAFMPSGSSKIAATQCGSVAENKRLDHDTTKALLNISFGTYKRKPEPLHLTVKEHTMAREILKCDEPNAKEKCGSAVDSRAANEVEKNVSVPSSSFQKCLQTADKTKMSQAGLKRSGPSRAF